MPEKVPNKERRKEVKKVRIITPVYVLVLVLVAILGVGVGVGTAVNQFVFQAPEATPSRVQSWPLPPTMEDIYPFESPQATLDEYLSAAYADAKEISQYLDIAYPGAKVMWEEHGGFSSKEEIANFLATVQFGNCRHRAAYAYWLLQALYPASEIRAAVGYVYVPSLMSAEEGKVRFSFVDESAGLDSNHAWLLIDEEVFDPALNPQTVRYYHPYGWCFYQKKVERVGDTSIVTHITFPRYDVYREEVEEQFRYDKGLTKTPREDIPPWWYQ